MFLKKARYLFILIVFFVVVFVAKGSINYLRSNDFPNVKINDTLIRIEISDTPEERVMGLSYREKLENDSGMLFIFNEQSERSFWMKNMNFPIDIIWMQGDRVVRIDKNLPPEGDSPQNHYSSIVPVDHVLEVAAGVTEKNNLKVGDTVKYDLKNEK